MHQPPRNVGVQSPPGWFKVYLYPSRQISWDALDRPDAEAPPATLVVSNASAPPAELKVPPVSVTFDLTSDCDKLKEFHREFGTKYSGWLNSDGTVSEGWKSLLRYVVGQPPLENTLVSVAQKYTWRQIWNDEAVRWSFRTPYAKRCPPKPPAPAPTVRSTSPTSR